MTKMTTQFFSLLSLLFISSGLIAQSPFWAEDFSSGAISDTWSNEDLATNADGNGEPILALWEHCSTPATCPPATFTTMSGDPIHGEFAAETAANGYIFMNADTLGALTTNFESQLTTEAIDCSNESAVFIKFASHIATSNNNAAENAVLRVSTDASDWQSFTLYPDLTDNNAPFGSDNPEIIMMDISAVAANSATVYIQWQWVGNDEWSWALDDIGLYSSDPSISLPEGTLWLETFNGGSEGWTFNPVTNDYVWEFSTNGNVSNGAYAANGTVITSPTQSNGSMALNADFLQTGGTPLPAGSSLDNAVTELISPVIDLSAVNTPVALEFYQLIRRLNPVQGNFFSSYSLSTDGGNTWGDPFDANATLGANAAPLTNRMYFPLENVLGEDSLRLKFTYAGDFYYWVLDDISIIERPLNDMQANENYFAIPTNFNTPLSQVEPIYFLSDIQNVGGADQTGVELSVTIERGANEVFSSVEDYGTITVDSLAENVIFEETFTPTQTGSYSGIYEVSADEEDAQLDNNTLPFSFIVSDTTFAKENGAQGGTRPTADDSYTFGNVFYVPNGEDWYARYISFQYSNAEDLAAAGADVTTILYKWDGTGAEDFMLTVDDNLELLSFNSYSFQGNESGPVTIPVDLDGQTFELESGHYYLPVVEYATDDGTFAFMSVNRDNNFLANYFLQDSLEMPRYASALDVGNTGTFDFRGFGFSAMPVVRLHIGNNPDIEGPALVNNQEVLAEENIINLFPNPASSNIQLELELIEPSDRITVKIFDTQGRQLMKQDYKNVQKETLNYNIKALSTGTYFLQILTDKGTRAQRFIVK